MLWGHIAVQHLRLTVQHCINHRLAVQAVSNGLAYAHVAEIVRPLVAFYGFDAKIQVLPYRSLRDGHTEFAHLL